jgi:ATP-binding cassette, subfamily C, bacterial CydCD
VSRPVDPRLIRVLPTIRRYLVLLSACQAVSAVLIVAQAGLVASSVVTVFVRHEFGGPFAVRLILLGIIGAGRAGVAAVIEYASARASVRARADLRRKTLDGIVRLGPAWAQRQTPGYLANVTGPGLDGLDGYVTRALPALVGATIIPVAVLVAITAVDLQSGLLLLVMLPLVPLFMVLVGMTTKRRVQRQYLLLGRLAGQFLDLLRGMSTLRIYGQAERQERTLHDATDRFRRETMSALRITFLSALVLDLVAALSVAVVAVDVGLRLDGRDLSFLTALVVLFLAPELFAPLRAMGAQFHANEQGAIASGACLDLIAEASGLAATGRGEVAGNGLPANGTVALDGVRVRYDGRESAALDGVQLAVQPGELVVLDGESGAGKSTVLLMLLGFTAPTDGSVLIGFGHDRVTLIDLADLDADEWRRNIAWLPQRPMPTQATVADEVRLGDPSASELDVTLACAQCATPRPETRLGEDGRWVSAGQRRRIALARALIRARAASRRGGVPLVLLDEPSEDLDHETEQVVVQVIMSMRGWATVIVATHSSVLADLAQRRVTLADGRIIANIVQPPHHVTAVLVQGQENPDRPHRVQTESAPLRLRDIARQNGLRGRLARAAALSALAGLTGLFLTATSTWLISRAAQHPNVQALAIAVVGVRTFALARALLRYAERLSSHDAALRLLTGLRVQVFAALRPLGSAALGGYGRGDLLRRFVGDVDGAQDGLVRTFIPLAGAAATGLGAVILAAALAPAAGMALALALTIAGAFVPWLCARATGDHVAVAEAIGLRDARSTVLGEALGELVAYGAAAAAIDEIVTLDRTVDRFTRRTAAVSAVAMLLSGLTAALALPVVLLAGGSAVKAGRLSAVDLAVLAVCVLVGFEAVAPLPAAFAVWARCRAGLARVATILATSPAVPDAARSESIPRGDLGLRAVDLTLAPAAGAATVLRDIQLNLDVGRRIAITGPSGSGKSTLLAAVLRQIPVVGGCLELVGDGEVATSIDTVAGALLPGAVAGSLQGDHVFNATLRDNLRVVRPEASDAELDTVAARAGLTHFVAGLRDGWDTPVGPDGSALSGGERQRLLLARALLADPRILILDEPTAHLDAATERAVLADLLDATAGRTVLLATHRRLATEEVDAVVQISDGRLAQVVRL